MSLNMKIQASDLIHELAEKTQLLACLKWLSDFQVFACIPDDDKMSFANVADLVGVSVGDLSRVIRMSCTSGILCEPQVGFVAHSPLSAQFVKRPSLLDAIKGLAETVVPKALSMGEDGRLHRSALDPFDHPPKHDSRVERQVAALERLEASNAAESALAALSVIELRASATAKVVEVNAQSTVVVSALNKRHPEIHVILQMADDKIQRTTYRDTWPTSKISNVTMQWRIPGAAQSIDDASVYVLHLPTPSLTAPAAPVLTYISAELRAHFTVLRSHPSAKLILLVRVLPEPGTVDAEVEAAARMHDLWQLQMGNGTSLAIADLLELVDAVRDNQCKLMITRKLSTRRHLTMALEAQIRPLSDRSSHVFR